MSKTIRVSEELYDAIDRYRDKNQTFQDVIEEMAEEIGLLPDELRDVDDLRTRLEKQYGFDTEETSQVLEALRIVYIGQENKELTIGIPHEYVDDEYESEVDSLKRLGLVREEHYTGKYDYGYQTTKIGDEIASELVRKIIDERSDEVDEVLSDYEPTVLSMIYKFGFNKTDTGHLTNRSARLTFKHGTRPWAVDKLSRRYKDFQRDLEGLDVAAGYDTRFVLPPELDDYLRQNIDTDVDEIMKKNEVYRVILDYAQGDIETREEILNSLDMATEDRLEEELSELYQDGLTSKYLSQQETPLLIKDKDGVVEHIEKEMKRTLNLD
jgi:hypothetical protein